MRLQNKKKSNKPKFDLRAELFRITGTDLSQIDSIDVRTAMTILSEAEWDMSKWKDENHFVSRLPLSGGLGLLLIVVIILALMNRGPRTW